MKNTEQSAYPITGIAFNDDYKGLTKREYFAGLAMQGLLRNHLMIDTMNEYSKDWISKHSILIADELLKQLETK